MRKNANELLTQYLDMEREVATAQFDGYLRKELKLTTKILREYVTQDGYTGPWNLDNGFVLELSGDKVLTAELSPDVGTQISREQIEESLASDTMRSAKIEIFYTGDDDLQTMGNCYLSFGRITDTLIYAEVTPEEKFDAFLGFHTQDRQDAVDASNARFDKSTEVELLYNNYLSQAMILFFVFLIIVTLIVYVMAQKQYAREKILEGDALDNHNPSKVKKVIMNATASGAVAVLVISFLTMAVGQMYRESRYGEELLQILAEKYADNKKELKKEAIEGVQEEWFVRYGSEIAAFIEDHPETAAQEELIKFSDILETDFIIVFDSKGNQLACSDQYEGLSVERGLGENAADFRRLYYGVPSIVHEVSKDATTGLERKMIGVSMLAPDDPTRYGALVMALMPDQIKDLSDSSEDVEQKALLRTEHTLCFIADSTTGKILYSGEPSMVGQDVRDCGLKDDSIRDGYMDYGIINGVRSFIITKKSENNILYYATQYTHLRAEYLAKSNIIMLLYLLLTAFFMFLLMRGYSDEKYREWAAKAMPAESRENSLVNRLFGWNKKSPENKAEMVFYGGLFIMLQMWTWLIAGREIANGRYGSMLDYLLMGDWMRGPNLYALCSVLIVIAIANLVIMVSGWGLQLLAGFLTPKGETICMLFKSMIKYMTMIVAAIVSLNYLGILSPAVVASLGIGSVALSLGAKDVVADMLAGIFIVFEETIRVGDFIEYNGMICVVETIGIRSTKLSIPPGNFMVVNNHEISSVTNLSKDVSYYFCNIVIVTQKSLSELEELFKRELPEISKKDSRLTGPIKYFGIVQLGTGTGQVYNNPVPTMTVCIGAPCEQKDLIPIKFFVNKEIRLIAEREGIIIV